jgi:hypothetical protein
VVALLRLARRSFAASAVIEIIRAAPHSKEELDCMPTSSLFPRLVLEGDRFSKHDERFFNSVAGYFGSYLVNMPPERRALLEACVVGALLGCGMG